MLGSGSAVVLDVVEAGVDIALSSTDFLKDLVAVLVEHFEGGHRLDAVLLGHVSGLVDIDLDQVDASLGGLLGDVGGDGLAGSAPGGVEIDEAEGSLRELGRELAEVACD